MRGVPIFLQLTLLLLLAAPVAAPAAGEESLRGPTPVDLSADELSYDKPTETWRARGDVRLQKGDLTLLSDEVRWNPSTDDAEAIGHVRLTSPEAITEGEDLSINLESGTGSLSKGRILLRETSYRLAGEEIERLGENRYRVTDGTFTTCEGEPPAWKFTARRLDVTLGRYAQARHVLFYLRDVPIFYTPFLAYPVKTERESGFLMPRAGSSSRRGFQFSLAWYQVIDRNQDATLYLDYYSKLGIGNGLEYRYILGRQNEGDFHLYYVTGLHSAPDRSAFAWRHKGQLPGEVRLAANVQYVSSRDYFKDFGETAGEYNKDETKSIVWAGRSWRFTNLAGQLRYIKNLQTNNDLTLQKLPEATFTALPYRLWNLPLYLALTSDFTNFWRQEGITGQRLTFRPELSAVFHPGEILDIRPAVGYRERFYWTSGEGSGSEQDGLADFSTRISSRFSRIFSVSGEKIRKIRHSIEPELVYRYVPAEDQSHLPQFDTLDTIEPVNRIDYALVNRLVARMETPGGEPYYHEFLYLRLSQGYDIREARSDPEPSTERQPFTPLRTELIVRPNTWSYLDLDMFFNVNSGEGSFTDRFTAVSARSGVRDSSGNGVALDYQYQRDTLDYLGATVDIAWLRPIYLNYQHRQDFNAGQVLEKVLNLEYRAQCWSIFLTLRDRLEGTEFLVSFSLSGLGRIAGFGGQLGGPTD